MKEWPLKEWETQQKLKGKDKSFSQPNFLDHRLKGVSWPSQENERKTKIKLTLPTPFEEDRFGWEVYRRCNSTYTQYSIHLWTADTKRNEEHDTSVKSHVSVAFSFPSIHLVSFAHHLIFMDLMLLRTRRRESVRMRNWKEAANH